MHGGPEHCSCGTQCMVFFLELEDKAEDFLGIGLQIAGSMCLLLGLEYRRFQAAAQISIRLCALY